MKRRALGLSQNSAVAAPPPVARGGTFGGSSITLKVTVRHRKGTQS